MPDSLHKYTRYWLMRLADGLEAKNSHEIRKAQSMLKHAGITVQRTVPIKRNLVQYRFEVVTKE